MGQKGTERVKNMWLVVVMEICGVIKQNQSEVGHIQFSKFAENPIEIEQPVQKISAIKEFPKLPLFGYISKSIFPTSD